MNTNIRGRPGPNCQNHGAKRGVHFRWAMLALGPGPLETEQNKGSCSTARQCSKAGQQLSISEERHGGPQNNRKD